MANKRTRVPELAAWMHEQTWSEFAQSLAQSHHEDGGWTEKQIEAAKRMKAKVEARDAKRRAESTPDGEMPAEGFYLVGDEFFRVQANRKGTSRYAKIWDPEGKTWRYAGRAPFIALTPDRLMTREQAAAFGHQFGICMVCSAELTDPDSVARGMGPVCWSKYGEEAAA